MPESSAARPALRLAPHALALLSAAVAIGVLVIARGAHAELGTLFLGCASALLLLHFAWTRHRRARSGLQAGTASAGRIHQRPSARGVVFLLPGEGIEPWAANGWILAVTCLGSVSLAELLHGAQVVLLGFVAALCAALALRLRGTVSDYIEIELRDGGWRVDALAGGRANHRTGAGLLLPELTSEALLLWSSAGRVGFFSHELEPEERSWLANELSAFAAGSAVSPTEKEVNHGQAENHGQRDQGGHAD